MAEGGSEVFKIYFTRALIPFMRTVLLWSVTSQRPHLLTSPHWGLGFNIWIWWWVGVRDTHKPSGYSNYFVLSWLILPRATAFPIWYMTNSSLGLLAPYINLPHTHTSPSPVRHQKGFGDSSTYRAPAGKLESGDHSRETNKHKNANPLGEHSHTKPWQAEHSREL